MRNSKLPRLIYGGMRPRREICRNPGLPFTMVPCFHQKTVYIERKLRVWKALKCIPLVGGKTALTCEGLQTTSSHVRQYRTENGNLRKSVTTFYHGTVFPPKECLYYKEATGMENPKMFSPSRWKNRTYLCGPPNYLNWDGPLSMVRVCTKAISIPKETYGYGETRNVFR